jgi:anti-anti-sigma factor
MAYLPEIDDSNSDFVICELEIEGGREIRVTGELDLANVPLLRDACSTAAADRRDGRLVLDLAGVTFIDSTGIHGLIDAYESHADRLRIITSPEVSRMLDVCGLRSRLPIVEA